MLDVSYLFPEDRFPQCYHSDRDAIAEWFRENAGIENQDWGVKGYWFKQMHYWVLDDQVATLFHLRWQR
jgi:hypothetical protein